MKRTIFFLSLFIFSVEAYAQDDKKEIDNLSTDRPTQSISPFTVGKGNFQIETGFLFQESTLFLPDLSPQSSLILEGKAQLFTYNTSLFRYGISDRIELRLGQELRHARIVSDGALIFNSDTELVPTFIGAKVSLVDEAGTRPAISFVAHVGGPLFIEQEFRTLGTVVDFRFNFQHQLTDELSVAYNLGGSIKTNANNNAFTGLYTALVGYSLSEKLSTFVEFYGFLQSGVTPKDHQIDFGLTYLVNPNFQLDVFGGTGFSDLSPDTIFGFGLSVRIPKN